MQVRSLTGDDEINALAMGAMKVTVESLEADGVITAAQAKDFLDRSVCMIVPTDGAFKTWVKRVFGDTDDAQCRVVIAKIDK